jgi:hypothetical protein
MYLLLTFSFLAIATLAIIVKPTLALAVNQTQQEEIEEKALNLIKSTESKHWQASDEWTEDEKEEEEEVDEEK